MESMVEEEGEGDGKFRNRFSGDAEPVLLLLTAARGDFMKIDIEA